MTTMVNVKVDLPDALAQKVTRMGLLQPDVLQSMLREAVRIRRIAQLAEARRSIAAAGVAPLTMEEIKANRRSPAQPKRLVIWRKDTKQVGGNRFG
jgi:hypothetical protein